MRSHELHASRELPPGALTAPGPLAVDLSSNLRSFLAALAALAPWRWIRVHPSLRTPFAREARRLRRWRGAPERARGWRYPAVASRAPPPPAPRCPRRRRPGPIARASDSRVAAPRSVRHRASEPPHAPH